MRSNLDRFSRCSKSGLLLVAFLLAASAQAAPPKPAPRIPNARFGPNVFVFDPSMPREAMQEKIDKVYAEQVHSEFGSGRYAFLFLPGDYHLDIPVGFYTQVLGLGASPDAVHITGNVHADASLPKNNATCVFWRAAEGFSVSPTGDTKNDVPQGTMQWAVSQAVSFRRMHVLGGIALHQRHGWASGGWMSDTKVDGTVDSGSQQQWLSRNVNWHAWTGSSWNMVFVGTSPMPDGDWPKPAYTKIDAAPVINEKPFLQSDGKGSYSVLVPALAHNTTGITWTAGSTPGRSVALDRFYLAQPGKDTAATLNAALRSGRNLLLTPGVYDLAESLRVTRKDTVVYGLGFATLHPTRGTAAMTVADVDGISLSGLLFDAGETTSPVLLQIGDRATHTRHIADPISLHDIFFRVGGAAVGKTVANLVINSNDVLVDHTWIWRADHGNGVGWTSNTSANGLIVNGSDVTIYGLFVEHHQQFQVLWNGDRGRTFFYQSEIPYDPPDQQAWKSAADTNGWASYKVADTVTTHEAWGLGVYSVFRLPDVILSHAIETPILPGVRFHHLVTLALDNLGQITHVINDTGETTSTSPRNTPRVDQFPPTQ